MNRIEIEDRNQEMSEFVHNELTDQKMQQDVLKKFVMSSLMDQKLEQENVKENMVKSLMDQKLKQHDDVTDQNVNQSRTTENDSERDVHQVRIQEKVETIWLCDTGADAHVMPVHVREQLGDPSLQTTQVALRGANGQDLGAMGEVQVKGFFGKIKVQFTAVVARDARRCLLSGTQLRTKGNTLNQHGSFLVQPNGSKKVTMSREGNSDTLKVVCLLKPRDAQSVTSLMLKRELENVRRELRKLETGQHENKRERAKKKTQ